MPQKFALVSVLVVLFVAVAGYLWTSVFPYRFSQQAPLNIPLLTGVYEESATSGVFAGQRVAVPPEEAAAKNSVLGDNTSNKRIEVDLSAQRLYAFEGDRKIFDFPVSTGKWWPTPTGTFRLWIKLRYTRMKGGSQALGTYYDLPNVPYTMFFYNDQVPQYKGFGIHGAYWHNNFGHPMSHGCVNMRIPDSEQLFYWAEPQLRGLSSIKATADNPGTPVIIYGVTPKI